MSTIAGRTLLRSATRSVARTATRTSRASPIASITSSRIAPTLLQARAGLGIRTFSSTMTVGSGAPTAAPSQEYDKEIRDIANFALNYKIDSDVALDTARLVFLDTIGCGLKALEFPECTNLLGPIVPGTTVPNGARVPGTPYVLDPLRASFSWGAAIRWLDFNDCWLAAVRGHPSDQLGAYLSVADWVNRTNKAGGEKIANGKIFTVKDVLEAMIKGHEIQGVIALENALNRVGLDHVALVKIGATAVVSQMLGLSEEQTKAAISHAFVDGQSLRTYRHSPNAMSRKSWAAGDACERAVSLVLKVLAGQGGIPTVLSTPVWGTNDVLFKGQPLKFQRDYGSYVMENVLFKVSYPAEFHSQTAVEAAEKIYKKLAAQGKSAADIESVVNRTHEACIRIIDKQFKPMTNYADRDHCVQWMVSCMLTTGKLVAEQYLDNSPEAKDELLESLRQRIKCVEDPQFTADYHDPAKRTIANGLTVTLKDGTVLEEEVVEAPLGHRWRREESVPHILAKYKYHVEPHYPADKVQKLIDLGNNPAELYKTDIDDYVSLYVKDRIL